MVYRIEFKLPADYKGKTIWLGFDGINYRANLWMNGVGIASCDNVAGTWRLFQLDVRSAAKTREMNTLAVEVFPPQPRDLASTFVDWAPMPPDKEMGIWRDVHVVTTGPIVLRSPAVLTKLNLPATNEALIVRAELTNTSKTEIDAVVKGRIENLNFQQSVHLAPTETKVVRFTPEKFAQLKISNPRLWWPARTFTAAVHPAVLTRNSIRHRIRAPHIRIAQPRPLTRTTT